MTKSQLSSIHIHCPVIVLVFALVTTIFPKEIKTNGYSKPPAGFDFSERRTDNEEYQTTIVDSSKNTNAMTTAMTIRPTVYTDVSTTNDNTILENVCATHGTCEKATEPGPLFRFCNCGSHCEEYNNCCNDHNRTGNNLVKSQYECLIVNSQKNNRSGFFAISVCPDGYNNTPILWKCNQQNIVEHGPPVVHNNTKLFMNKYCALCHEITDFIPFDVQFYYLQINEEEFKNLSTLTRFQKLSFIFYRAQYELVPPTGTELVWCFSKLIENNNMFCQLFINPVYYGNSLYIYRNIHCVPPAKLQYFRSCLMHDQHSPINSIQELSVIFSFRETMPVDTKTRQCEEWSEEVFRNILLL